ncbi:MAG: putative bifunctional diguanylate cyclase/phosphodiesterase [Acidiferrobacterales bacterium]
MNRFTVAELLSLPVTRVQANQRYCDVPHSGDATTVFAVFDGDRYLGLAAEGQLALSPEGVFAEFAAQSRVEPLPGDARVEEVLEYIRRTRAEHIPVVDEKGRFLGVVSQVSLFAALVAHFDAELRRHSIAASVFDNTSDGIVVTDASANIILVNRAFTETTGYTLEEVRGQRPSLLSSGHHEPDFYQSMWQSLQNTGAWSGEIWNRRKNGEIYPEWLRISSVRDGQGAVTNYVGIFAEISSQQHLQRQLHQLAYYDALTGLPNRQLFYDRIGQAIVRAKRDGSGFAILFIDLDRFKDINDSLGHSFGDKLLQAAACRIKGVVRETDTVSRLGGDEFTILLSETGSERDVAAIASNLVQSSEIPLDVDGRKIYLTASVGIARYPNDGRDVDMLVKNADVAMYRAKREGRNRYCFFTSELNVQVLERLSMEGALRTSLKGEGLYMVWQPQVRLVDGEVIGVEALARWRHPHQGEVAPAQFIPLAEEAGLMPELGNWVLEAAAAGGTALAGICRRRPMSLGVNISASQLFEGEALKQNILDTLERTGLGMECFELELSESTLMNRGRRSEAVLGELRRLGLQLTVDDFGTGFSKLSCLKRLAVQRVKIDQELIRDLAEDAVSRQLVSAIIQMAHGLDIRVSAEGVETDEQRSILLQLGCDEGQGVLFGKPMDLSALIGQLSL